MYPLISQIIELLDRQKFDESRLSVLNELSAYLLGEIQEGKIPKVNFICTHNSRRSVLAQTWMTVLAGSFNLKVKSFSGGTEVTEVNKRVIYSLRRMGFSVISDELELNSNYEITFSDSLEPIICFSKLFSDEVNPSVGFLAVMTCGSADENCPIVPGAERRLPIKYEDPKKFDDSPLESLMYDARSIEIAAELYYVLFNVKSDL
tara:strand:- start:828 stop:1442 length:615 start_codon:yes stop_codon:yes gene_type:complete